MDRRRFLLTSLAGALAAPHAAEAQKVAKVSRVGYLNPAGSAGSGRDAPITEAFYAGLREQGYIIGRDLFVEERYADGTPEQFLTAARELVALPVDVLVSGGTAASLAAKKATSTTPIVWPHDPAVAAGASGPDHRVNRPVPLGLHVFEPYVRD